MDSFNKSYVDPEPWRCRRTDGKRWRCYLDALVHEKYCERHMHRGSQRSRKHVEVSKVDLGSNDAAKGLHLGVPSSDFSRGSNMNFPNGPGSFSCKSITDEKRGNFVQVHQRAVGSSLGALASQYNGRNGSSYVNGKAFSFDQRTTGQRNRCNQQNETNPDVPVVLEFGSSPKSVFGSCIVGLPESELWKAGKANNLRLSREFCEEASRLLSLPAVIDYRKVDKSVLEAADLDYLASGPRFLALSQASLDVIVGAIASNTTTTEARMRELAARKRARRQGGQPPADPAPTRAPSAREEVQAAPADLEHPMSLDPASTVPLDHSRPAELQSPSNEEGTSARPLVVSSSTAESEPMSEEAAEANVPSRRRRIGIESSLAEAVTSSAEPPRVTRHRVIEYKDNDSALDPGIARKMIEASVLPYDRRKFECMDWEKLHLSYQSNLALIRAQELDYLSRAEELRRIAAVESQRCMEITRHYEVLTKEMEPLKAEVSKLKAEISSLKSKNSSLREGKEESDTRLTTANSRVDELMSKVADLELTSTQARSDVESLQQELEVEKKDKAALSQQFKERLESARMEAIAEFKQSEFFMDNLLMMQNSVMEAGQTKAIDVCSEMIPTLDKQDPRIAELYNPSAFEEFNEQLQQSKGGADLREL